jgi:DnaJ-class molecular chaperone
MSLIPCSKCSGEGSLYTSRHGGNDPDVWRTGECDACKGSGNQACEARGCSEPAVAFNDDGEALCEDCLSDWTIAENESEGNYP